MGRLSTHVLDTHSGHPAAGVTVWLERIAGGARDALGPFETNADGRIAPLLEGDLEVGLYELHFHIGDYFRAQGVQLPEPPFFDVVTLRFGIADSAVRAELAGLACGVIDDPRFASVFAPDALAEVPLAAVVEGRVIAGKVDRLHVAGDRVSVVDFKTNRRAPASLAGVPESHLKQMAAYAAALAEVFPGKAIEMALLYTAGPSLLPLDAATLARFKPRFAET